MYVISECITCVVLTITLSTFLFAFCVVLLTIKDRLESRRGTSRAFRKVGMLLGARPATVLVRDKTLGR
jgi:hypothetical protein